MAMSPDTFLLITICSGVLIIVVGMIIAINSPLKALSCSFYCQQCGRLFSWICRRRKEQTWKRNIINHSSDKKLSLVEGRPQGHGFYSAGPWSSTETTSTCLGGDTLHQSGMLSGAYFAMMNGNIGAGGNGITAITDNNSSSTAVAYGAGSSSSLFTNYGIHGDNSSALNFGHMVCLNCHGAGFINPGAVNMYQVESIKSVSDDYRQQDNQSQNSQLGGSSSGGLSASSDSMMDADDMDGDADADMMM
ncbi:hypothetical protein Ocin01_07085 [Orchesella cincta]|uniref:Uncharacterized protein n=1 Tax=Orchesella cincta TaxID=48709 RepID=A0A1D2N2Z5_ORCCI|nr:hypothetical protein Ocin01_07085 [Orchesella cincta]